MRHGRTIADWQGCAQPTRSRAQANCRCYIIDDLADGRRTHIPGNRLKLIGESVAGAFRVASQRDLFI
jgi:hypothetical protein